MSIGSLSPATYPTEAITIRCDRCSRVGRYKRQTLVERYGDAAIPRRSCDFDGHMEPLDRRASPQTEIRTGLSGG